MIETFDLVVIGSGTAAQAVASRCRKAGWTVAMIDKRPFGGTCALRGCDPKKVLVGAAAAVDAARLLSGKGVRPESLAIDWTELIRFKRTFTDPHPEHLKAKLAGEGIVTFQSTARFVDPAHIDVGGTVLNATRAIVIAAGARPADLPIAGREHVATSDQFLDLPSLPASIAFVGVVIAGVIVGIWVHRGFGALSEERLAVLAATLIIVGIQVFFSSFLLSILGLRRTK